MTFKRHSSRTNAWTATGETDKEATGVLAAQLLGTLDTQRDGMVVTLGGAEGYEDSIHLIAAGPGGQGWAVHAVRTAGGTAKLTGSWLGTQDTQATTLEQVLRHIGGSPEVVRL